MNINTEIYIYIYISIYLSIDLYIFLYLFIYLYLIIFIFIYIVIYMFIYIQDDQTAFHVFQLAAKIASTVPQVACGKRQLPKNLQALPSGALQGKLGSPARSLRSMICYDILQQNTVIIRHILQKYKAYYDFPNYTIIGVPEGCTGSSPLGSREIAARL